MAMFLIQTSIPDFQHAQQLAHQLLVQKLAACVHIAPQGQSLYYWQGKLECQNEHLLTIKTSASARQACVDAIVERHPYDVPEIISLPIQEADVSPAYLAWIIQQTEQ